MEEKKLTGAGPTVDPYPGAQKFIIRKGGVLSLMVIGERGGKMPLVGSGIPAVQIVPGPDGILEEKLISLSGPEPVGPAVSSVIEGVKAFARVLARKGGKRGKQSGARGGNPFPSTQGRANTFSINTLLPARLFCKMSFGSQLNVAAASSIFSGWRANDLYDPDVALGGPELVGFSEIMAFYKYFRVVRFRLRLNAIMFTSGKVAYAIVWPASVAPSGGETFQQLAGQPGAQECTSWNDLAGPTQESLIQTPWIAPCDLLGIDRAAFSADESTWGTATTSPTRLCYINIYATSNDSSAVAMTLKAEIEFEAEFFSRVELTS
jgi:hypothetical protein